MMEKFEIIAEPISSFDIDWNMRTRMQDLLQDHFKVMANREEDLVKDTLLKIGYGDLIKSIYTRFPKVLRISLRGWKYYFLDNGTPSGLFFIAVSEWKSSIKNDDPAQFGVSANIKFDYHRDINLVPPHVLNHALQEQL